MKRILITGAGSYIGTSFENYLKQWKDIYSVDTVDMIDGSWREKDFSGYDVVFHVAGIAHRKETEENKHLYYEVNRDLAIETAEKAKNESVGAFILLSSMSVYGKDVGVINRATKPAPVSNYGISKLQAEECIAPLASDNFKVCIIRPPMVYGKGCKGNFNSVVKIVKRSPIFPKISNQRSMIYIDNLCGFVRLAIDESLDGVFMPQNKEKMNTSQMAGLISSALGKHILLDPISGAAVSVMRKCSQKARKAFGTLVYEDTETFDYSYCTVSTEESVTKSV